MSLIQPLLACKPLNASSSVEDMGRILLAIAAIIVAFMLLGPLVGFIFTLLKWALVIGAVALGVMLLTKWAKRS
ncbi:hypothetical protein SAMN05660976_03204 [Nonomuraea pusilla]|uniref:Uncharacterized protein n=2 Tax=Nonomuraea pusilla TaxID=46177 RepID=A0A1H7SKI5_9ACTN|nr:hypothetical protein SAMN05660976_03204 [Nonomuraea pusilla]